MKTPPNNLPISEVGILVGGHDMNMSKFNPASASENEYDLILPPRMTLQLTHPTHMELEFCILFHGKALTEAKILKQDVIVMFNDKLPTWIKIIPVSEKTQEIADYIKKHQP